MEIYAEKISQAYIQNKKLYIKLGEKNTEETNTLIIPINQAPSILKNIAGILQKIKQQQKQKAVSPSQKKEVDIQTDQASRVCWIASYPKSGNTWMRMLVGYMFFQDMESYQDIYYKIPGVHKYNTLSVEGNDEAFLKTHWPWWNNMPGGQHTCSAIYIVRNPFDVLVSHFNYLSADTSEDKEALFQEFINYDGIKRWLSLNFGSWKSNVESWILQQHSFPIFIVRYEDLLKSCSQQMLALRNFLNLDISDEKVQEAVELSSFNRVKNIEQQEIQEGKSGLFFKGYKAKNKNEYSFMNKGKAGYFFDILTEEQILKLHEKFEPLLDKLGYRLDIENKDIILEEPAIELKRT